MKTISEARCEVTVKRPNGQIETIVHPKIDRMNDALYGQMKAAMKTANKGECVSYKNIDAVVEMEDADYAGHCKRCSTKIDTRNGNYCHDCGQLINAMTEGR
jgi:hypothetical protein